MSSLALGFIPERHTGTGMHYGLFLHDEAIVVQLLNVAAGIGQRNFVDFVGIQPYFAFAAFENVRGEALLQFERDCTVVVGFVR